MDFTWFIANAERIEPALKSGIYIVQLSRIPPEHQAFRCGLAGKPSDAVQRAFQGTQAARGSPRMSTLSPDLFVDAICRNTSPPGTGASRWRERAENNKMTLNEKEWTSRPSYS